MRRARQCPVGGCGARIRGDELMCRHHWSRVPSMAQDRVWEEFSRRQGSPQHLAACRAAIKAALEAA